MGLHKHIALQHRRSRQLPALIVSWVGTLALVCSALAVASGVFIVGLSLILLSHILYIEIAVGILIAIMGGIVSFLVEGMTIANCSSLKDVLIQRNTMQQKQAQVLNNVQQTEAIKERKRAQLASSNMAVRFTVGGIVITSIISAVLSTLFWHYLLTLGNYGAIEGWIYSSTFSVVVTIALVFSELKSESFERIVAGSISSVGLLKSAIDARIQEQAMLQYGDSMETYLNEEGADNQTLKDAASEHVLQIVSNSIKPGDNGLLETMREQRETRILQESNALAQLEGVPSSPTILLPNGYKARVDKQKSLEKYTAYINAHGVPSGAEELERAAKEVGVSPQTIYRYGQK